MPKLTSTDKLRGFLRKLGEKAQAEPNFRFYALYDKLYRWDVLSESWRQVHGNGGACGIDGQTIAAVEASGVEEFLHGYSIGSGETFGREDVR